jgi:hypothetical protein
MRTSKAWEQIYQHILYVYIVYKDPSFQAFIEYLRMRGYEDNDFFGAEPVRPRLNKSNWTSVSEVSSLSNFNPMIQPNALCKSLPNFLDYDVHLPR